MWRNRRLLKSEEEHGERPEASKNRRRFEMRGGCSDSKVITFDLDSCLLTAKAASACTEPRQRGHSSPTIPPTIERAALPRILMERRLDSFGQPVVDAPIHPLPPFARHRGKLLLWHTGRRPSPASTRETLRSDRFFLSKSILRSSLRYRNNAE